MADALGRRLRLRLDERGRRDDLAGSAEPALERVRADERIHQRVVAEPFDRRHLALADGVHERDAREDRHAVELDGARAAVALTAGDLGTGQRERPAERLGQRLAYRSLDLVPRTVDQQLKHQRLRVQLHRQ